MKAMKEDWPQSAPEFASWLGDQLSEDLETYDIPRRKYDEKSSFMLMTRNGVKFEVSIKKVSE